jgi:hypothetical protein
LPAWFNRADGTAASDLHYVGRNSRRTKGEIMKKLLTLTLLLSSFAFIPTTKAANLTTGAAFNTPQVRIQIGRRRHRRNWDRAYGDRVGYGRDVYA